MGNIVGYKQYYCDGIGQPHRPPQGVPVYGFHVGDIEPDYKTVVSLEDVVDGCLKGSEDAYGGLRRVVYDYQLRKIFLAWCAVCKTPARVKTVSAE